MRPCLLSPELDPMRVNAVRQSSFLFAARLEKSRDPRDVLRTSSRGQTGANGATHQPPMFSRARLPEERFSVELDGLWFCKCFAERRRT